MTKLIAVLALVPLAGCPAGGAAEKIRSDQPTVDDNKQVAPEECDTTKSYEALAVDWEPEVRGDLEVAMKQGVAVVAYDCNSIRLLADCTMDGSYGFIGMTRKEKVVSMQDSDEVKANLPMSGVKFLAKIGGEIKRGTSLDAAMVMIGKNNSGRKRADRSELDEDCEAATHFVRSATLGAFVLATSSSADAKVAANFFGDQGGGAGSASEKKVHNKDGDLDDCKAAKPDANKPPAQCGAVLRLSLKPIKSRGGVDKDVAVDVPSCPGGTVMTDAGCEKPEPDKPYQCELGDSDTCEQQCKKGHAGSCYVLGSMLYQGLGGRKDWERAASVLVKGCDGDSAEACRVAGAMYSTGQGVDKDAKRAESMLTKSCDGGDALGCVELGKHMLARKNGDAQYVFRRACYGGEYEGCTWLGTMRQDGLGGMRKNPKLANKFFEKGCKEGSALACYKLAANTRAGKGTNKDKARAKQLFEKACAAGHEPACAEK